MNVEILHYNFCKRLGQFQEDSLNLVQVPLYEDGRRQGRVCGVGKRREGLVKGK